MALTTKQDVFHKDSDYVAFLKLINQANDRVNMRLLAFCLMPNHFHLVAWPRKDGDYGAFLKLINQANDRVNMRGQIKGDAQNKRGRS